MSPYSVLQGAKALFFALIFASPVFAEVEEFNSSAVGSYQDPGANANRDFAGNGQVDSIDPFSGALKIVVKDLVLPGNGGLDIAVKRNYQSVTNEVGPYSNGFRARTPFGTGWDINFGRIWVSKTYQFLNPQNNNSGCTIGQVASNLNPILELSDGSKETLANGDRSDHSFITKGRWIGRCLPTALNKGVGGLLVYSPEGVKYVFNIKGTVSPDFPLLTYFVSRIEDPQGNYLDFTYNIPTDNLFGHNHLLTKITSSDGRQVVFNYDDETGTRPILTSVSGGGKTVRYAYVDALSNIGAKAHYMSRVSYSDGTDWNYKYNDQVSPVGSNPGRYSMLSMVSPLGLRTDYTYAYKQMGVSAAELQNIITGRVVSNIGGSTSNTHRWTYSYTKGYSPSNDVTVESGPTQCVRYEHVGSNTIPTGASAVDRGLWKIGLLVSKTIMAAGCGSVLRTETYTWGSQNISDQNEMRRYNLMVENYTRAPVMLSKVIQQGGSTYTTDFSYDSYGQPVSVVESGQRSRTTTITYTRPNGLWMLGKVATQRVSGITGEVSNSYTASGLLSQENRYGVKTSYAYTGDGDLASQTDANGKVTSYSNYYRGVPRKITYPDGAVESRTVNDRGTIATQTDPLGRVTSFTYDSMDRPLSVTPPKGAAAKLNIAYGFGSSGVTETLTRGSYKRVRQLNQLGQLIAQTESGGSASIVVTAQYDPSGQKVFVSHPNYGSASTLGERFSYDALGRLTGNTHADNTRVSMAYSGNSVVITDERNNVTTQNYASYGEPGERQLLSISQPGGVLTSMAVDNLGRVTTITQGGLSRSFNYDAKGFLATEVHPETGTTQYAYDAVGNVLSKKVGAAAADSYSYDARYRLKGITYGGSSLTLSNTYDIGGRLLSQSHAGSTWNYTYDAHDKLTSEVLSMSSPARSYSFIYAYNALDALTSQTYPSGLVVDYAPDAYGRPTKAGTFASALGFHANGALSGLTYGNGRSLTVSQYQARQRPTARKVSGVDTPMQLQYGYDAANNLTSIADQQNSAYSQGMGYDALNRLVSATGKWGAASYAYNVRGDLTSQSIDGRSIGYAYDSKGRLSGLSGGIAASLSYDAKGNVLSARGEYSYDAANNMSSLCLFPRVDCAASPDQRFAYDARGRRVLETMADGEQVISAYGGQGQLLRQDNLLDASIKEYIYVAGERVAETEQCESVDTDNDGLPNCYENHFGFNRKNPADGAEDADGDGLANGTEYSLGTDPRNPDSDFDGMPDGWEVAFVLNPRSASDGEQDPDGDGVPNAVEFALGKSPLAADAAAKVRQDIAPALDLLMN